MARTKQTARMSTGGRMPRSDWVYLHVRLLDGPCCTEAQRRLQVARVYGLFGAHGSSTPDSHVVVAAQATDGPTTCVLLGFRLHGAECDSLDEEPTAAVPRYFSALDLMYVQEVLGATVTRHLEFTSRTRDRHDARLLEVMDLLRGMAESVEMGTPVCAG